MLVELLSEQGNPADIAAEVERLSALLSGYPGFWAAWSAFLAKNPAMRDASLAIRFLAAALSGQSISWATIIEHGLASLLARQDSPHPAGSQEERVAEPAWTPEAPAAVPASEEAFAPGEAEEDVPGQGADAPEEYPAKDQARHEAALEEEQEDEDETEETFSLRTRSMAEVLAEQGDLAGALDIYQELIVLASPEERVSLEARADELSRRMKTGPSTDEVKADKAPAQGEGNRLVALLDSLAQRLEARAR